MKLDSNDQGQLFGIALIAVGMLVLLANLGLLAGGGNLLGGALFAAGGLLFLQLYSGRPGRVWALPVAFTLFGLAAAALTDGPLSGSYFLASIGVGFGAVYHRDRRNWWALIPGGVLLSLAVVAGIDALFPRLDPGPVLFLGLAATFGALYMLPEGGKRWAAYPALAAVVIALVAFSTGGGWLFPLLLVGVGAWLLNRQSTRPLETEVSRAVVRNQEAPAQPGASPASPAPAPEPIRAEPASDSPPRPDTPFVPDTRLADQIGDAVSREIDAGLDEKQRTS